MPLERVVKSFPLQVIRVCKSFVTADRTLWQDARRVRLDQPAVPGIAAQELAQKRVEVIRVLIHGEMSGVRNGEDFYAVKRRKRSRGVVLGPVDVSFAATQSGKKP
jgi:hypothetical protein